VRLRDGKPLGPEQAVKIGIGDAWPAGFAADGTLFYAVYTKLTDIFTTELDLTQGVVVKSPVRLLTRSAGAIRNPKYSPDGRKLLYSLGRDGSPWTLVLRDLDSGREREFPTGLTDVESEWMPDSHRVLVGRTLLDVDTGVKSSLPFGETLNGQNVKFLTPALDTNTLIVLLAPKTGSEAANARAIEYKLDSGATRNVYEAPPGFVLRNSAISPDGKSLLVLEAQQTAP
jgi:dipeptidyl aminopeptidase/acylaminoacyl peptidase